MKKCRRLLALYVHKERCALVHVSLTLTPSSSVLASPSPRRWMFLASAIASAIVYIQSPATRIRSPCLCSLYNCTVLYECVMIYRALSTTDRQTDLETNDEMIYMDRTNKKEEDTT